MKLAGYNFIGLKYISNTRVTRVTTFSTKIVEIAINMC